MDAQIDIILRELEALGSLPGASWYMSHVNSALRAAKKTKALATNDYKTLWEMECEETKRLAKFQTLYAEERLESGRLARQLLRYESPPVDPKAYLAQAGGEPPELTTQDRLNVLRWLSPDPSLACQPAPAVPAPAPATDDDLYD
jgi:hypothetical protein